MWIGVGVFALLSLAYLGVGPRGMPMLERARIPAIVFLICLMLLALMYGAVAQSVDKEAVRAELARRGYTCADLRRATKAKLIFWVIKEGVSADHQH